jgi:hypothetical protein
LARQLTRQLLRLALHLGLLLQRALRLGHRLGHPPLQAVNRHALLPGVGRLLGGGARQRARALLQRLGLVAHLHAHAKGHRQWGFYHKYFH